MEKAGDGHIRRVVTEVGLQLLMATHVEGGSAPGAMSAAAIDHLAQRPPRLHPRYRFGARQLKAITEELYGYSFFRHRRPVQRTRGWTRVWRNLLPSVGLSLSYQARDARYGRVREASVSVSQAVLIASTSIGDRRRQVLAVEFANRESRSS